MAAGSIFVITGPPAAGKTTVATSLAASHPRSVHLRADDFWGFIATGYIEPWLPEAHGQNEVVVRAVCEAAREFAVGGFAVILDGVLGPWFVGELLARTGSHVPVDYAILLPPLETLLSNLTSRTGHGFTSVDAAKHMYDDFVAAADGAYTGHVVNNGGLSAAETVAELLAARSQGRLRLPPPADRP